MNKFNIVRAWKDAEYRRSLSTEEQALLPEHPAGTIELDDTELSQVVGGIFTSTCTQGRICQAWSLDDACLDSYYALC